MIDVSQYVTDCQPCRCWTDRSKRGGRHGGSAWLLMSLVIASTSLAAEPKRPEFSVTAFDVGSVDQVRAKDTELAAELNAQEWCDAKAKPSARGWQEVPPGVDRAQWLSIVTVGFGSRADAYAFQFDGPHAGARLLAHVPHRKVSIRGTEQWTSPFVRLLGAARIGHAEARSAASAPALQLEVVEVAATVDQPTKKGKQTSLDEALTLSPEKVLPPLRVIATAAACSAGWAPTAAPADTRARVEVRVLDQACAFRVTFTRDGRETVVTKDRVLWEEFHDQLTLLFRWPSLGTSIVDFVRPHAGQVELLAIEKNRIVCLVDDELTALDADTGATAWQVNIPQSKVATVAKRVERYAARQDDQTGLRLFRWSTSLAEIGVSDGKLKPLATLAASTSSAFDVDAKGAAVIASGSRLSVFDNGKEVWSATETTPISCGPTFDADRVLFGTEQGELVAVSKSERRALWRVSLSPRLLGPITTAGMWRLVFSNEEETLFAIDPANGAVQWKVATGDVLLQPPLAWRDTIIVVTKDNRLSRLNPKSGERLAETRWPNWISSVQPIEVAGQQRLAVCDVSGKLTLLDGDLKPRWHVSLGTRLTGRAAMGLTPVIWKPASSTKSDSEDLLETIAADNLAKQPFLMTTDAAGFLFKLKTNEMLSKDR